MMFSKKLSRGYSAVAHNAHRIESYIKLATLAILASSLVVACGKTNGNGAINGVGIISIQNSGTAVNNFSGSTSLTVTVGDNSGQPPQSYTLNASLGTITGDLRQIGQNNVYELQATCANQNCTDVAFMIIARHGFTSTSATSAFSSYGSSPLTGNGVIYPYSATTGYQLTTQPIGSVEYLYRETGNGSLGVTWTLVKTLSDNTGTLSVLSQAQIAALESPN